MEICHALFGLEKEEMKARVVPATNLACVPMTCLHFQFNMHEIQLASFPQNRILFSNDGVLLLGVSSFFIPSKLKILRCYYIYYLLSNCWIRTLWFICYISSLLPCFFPPLLTFLKLSVFDDLCPLTVSLPGSRLDIVVIIAQHEFGHFQHLNLQNQDRWF